MLSYANVFLALLLNKQVPLYAGLFFKESLESHGYHLTSPCDQRYQIYAGPEGCSAGLLATEVISLLVVRCPVNLDERVWVVDHDTCSSQGSEVACHAVFRDVFSVLASF